MVSFKKTKATLYIVAFINIDVWVQYVNGYHEKLNEVIPREFLFKKTKETICIVAFINIDVDGYHEKSNEVVLSISISINVWLQNVERYHEKSNEMIPSDFPAVALDRLKSCPKPSLPIVHQLHLPEIT